jgi:hypothetical protein
MLGDVVADLDRSSQGMEFVNAQGGVDLNAGGPVWLGPFVMFTVGQHSHLRVASGGQRFSSRIADEAFHFWLIGGLRLQVRLPSL